MLRAFPDLARDTGGRVARSAQPVLPAGGGLILRPWRPTDARAVTAAYADPAIQRWHARRVDSEDEARDLILAVLHADGWHDMHVHARISGDEPSAG